MLTRRNARILKREVDDIPLPKTSRRPRKTVKRATPIDDFIRPGERIIIDTGINPDEQIKSRSINPVQESNDKRMINEQISACFREALTRNNVESKNIIPIRGNFGTPAFTIPAPEPKNVIPLPGDNIPLVPLEEILDIEEKKSVKPWAYWQTFLRKGIMNGDIVEPTVEQYDNAWTIWNHILKRTNIATKVSGPATGFTRADGPLITLLIRDHRGGTPMEQLINNITDPDLVHIQAFDCKFGLLERPVTRYLREKTVENALLCLRNVGWNDTPEEEKLHQLYF